MKGNSIGGYLKVMMHERKAYMEYELQGALRHGHPLRFVHGARDHDPDIAGGVVGAVLAGGEDHDAVGQLCGREGNAKPRGV